MSDPVLSTSPVAPLSAVVGTVMQGGRPWPAPEAARVGSWLVSEGEGVWENREETPTHGWLATSSVTLSGEGLSLGAPRPSGWAHLLAPELIRGQPADERADVFAAGVVIYALSTGRWPFAPEPSSGPLVPFDSEDPRVQAIVAETMEAAVVPPSSFIDGFPENLERALLTALTKDPWVRYQRLGDLRRDLAATADGATPAVVMALLERVGGASTNADGGGHQISKAQRTVGAQAASANDANPHGATAAAAPPVVRSRPPRRRPADRDKDLRPWLNVALWCLVGLALVGLVYGVVAAVQAPAAPEVGVEAEGDPTFEADDPAEAVGGVEPELSDDLAADRRRAETKGSERSQSADVRINKRSDREVGATTETGRVTIKANLRGASVFVDGALVGRTPLTAVVMYVGEHDFEVRAGPARWRQRRTVQQGELLSLTASLRAARVHLQELSNAECSIDDESVSTSGRRPLFVGEGEHSIRCVDPAADAKARPLVATTFEATAGSVHRFKPETTP